MLTTTRSTLSNKATAAPEQRQFSTVIMRGGSSKAVFLKEEELPKLTADREKLILALFGSPDKRQIDGLGGADYLTSKCAIMGPPTRADADIDYTFAQVSIVNPFVAFDVNCGNISAAAAVYAIEEGFVEAREPHTLVRIHNTNTGKILRVTVPVRNGASQIEGDCEVGGVPGSGAEIQMDFSGTVGACTGSLLPTGTPTNKIYVSSLGTELTVSIVDVANACVYVRAADLGLSGCELPGEIPDKVMHALEEIRLKSGELSGIISEVLPLPVIVAAPRSYASFATGIVIDSDEIDLVARSFLEGMMHKAYAGTAGTCLAVAAKIDGTLVHQVIRKSGGNSIRIGHPTGVLPIVIDVSRDDAAYSVKKASFTRTARRLLDGTAYVREARLV